MKNITYSPFGCLNLRSGEISVASHILMELRNTARHASVHYVFMGKPGVGKTQFLLSGTRSRLTAPCG